MYLIQGNIQKNYIRKYALLVTAETTVKAPQE